MPGFLSAADLAQMQADVASSLDLPCQIQRATTTRDQWGGPSEATAIVATTVCSLATPTAQLSQQYAARLANQQAWTARFPADTDLREGDVVLVNGQSITVMALLTPTSYSVSVRALLATER